MIPGRREWESWEWRDGAVVNAPCSKSRTGCRLKKEEEEEGPRRNGGNGYKDAISVVWSIAITSVPSFRRGVTWSLGNGNPKTLLRPGDGRASVETREGRWYRQGEREGLMDTYWYHLYTLKSFPLCRSIARAGPSRAGGIVPAKKAALPPHASVCKYFRAESLNVNSPRNVNTCATNQCLPRCAVQTTRAHTSSRIRSGHRGLSTRYSVISRSNFDVWNTSSQTYGPLQVPRVILL